MYIWPLNGFRDHLIAWYIRKFIIIIFFVDITSFDFFFHYKGFNYKPPGMNVSGCSLLKLLLIFQVKISSVKRFELAMSFVPVLYSLYNFVNNPLNTEENHIVSACFFLPVRGKCFTK